MTIKEYGVSSGTENVLKLTIDCITLHILEIIECYTLSGWTVWYVDNKSIKLLPPKKRGMGKYYLVAPQIST